MVKRAQGEITAAPNVPHHAPNGIRDWAVAVGKPIVTAGFVRAPVAGSYRVNLLGYVSSAAAFLGSRRGRDCLPSCSLDFR
jgi:hypothetical protein